MYASEKQFFCKICSREFPTAQRRYDHQRFCGKPKVICPHCDKLISARTSMRHIKQLKICKKSCGDCQKTYAGQQSYKRHICKGKL